MAAAAIVDVQGFKDQHNKFIVKELAILSSEDKLQHFIFQPPFKFEDLTPKIKKQVFWLKHNLHGFGWHDGYVPYHYLYTVVTPLLAEKNIYVKGLEKKEWLKDFLGDGVTIWNIEDELNCPKLSWLRFLHTEFSCLNHKGQCALQNVFTIRKFLVHMKQI